MGWFLGAGVGMMLAGPLGAVLGGVMQHMMTKSSGEVGVRGGEMEAVFVTNLAAIMTKVAMADGHISERERSVIHEFFSRKLGYHGENLRFIDELINETDMQDPPLEPICTEFAKASTLEIRMFLLNMLYQIALSDKDFSKAEEDSINRIATLLSIPADVHSRIKSTFIKGSAGNGSGGHYSVLGVDKTASDAEVKKAYRVMATQYHPDKVSHLGEELIEFASQKFSQINEAYSSIKKERGL